MNQTPDELVPSYKKLCFLELIIFNYLQNVFLFLHVFFFFFCFLIYDSFVNVCVLIFYFYVV